MHRFDKIMRIITEAAILAARANSLNQYLSGCLDVDDVTEDDLEVILILMLIPHMLIPVGEIIYNL